MTDHDSQNDASTELLVKQVTEGLSPEEQTMLNSIDPAIVAARRQSLELMLGALSAALVQSLEAPPETLQVVIEQQAAKHFGRATPDRRSDFKTRSSSRPSSTRWAWLSAAACLALAVVGWMRPPRMPAPPAPVVVQLNVPGVKVTTPKVPAPRTLAQERDALLERDDSLKVTLNSSKDPAGAGVSADVVWDPETNSGFLHIVGLKPNDPTIKQYQAWVFDGLRDKRYPLDCALFNMPTDVPEAIIRIRTAIPVRQAKAFAVTVEQAGGVVVPDKQHVVAVGSVG
jgi:anti-sigma-K factor RskA